MAARIYRPARNAMQSGKHRAKEWVLEFEPETPRGREPLMGWTSSDDTRRQLRLGFDTKEQAIEYAERKGIAYRVYEAHRPAFQKKSYADNFRYGRPDPWTH